MTGTGRTSNGIGLTTNGVGRTTAISAGTLTWGSGTDWDNATGEKSVVHDSHGDYPGVGTVQLGYPRTDERAGSSELVGYWPMHEDSGTTVNDFANNNDGTYNNGPALGSTGVANATAPNYDGVDDFGSAPDAAAWELEGPRTGFTLSFWFRHSVDNTRGRMWKHRDYGTSGWTFSIDASGDLRFFVDDAGTQQDVEGNGQYNDGSWHHCAVTRPQNGTGTLYIDGSQVAQNTSMDGDQTADVTMHWATFDDLPQNLFEGLLAEFRFYSAAHTATEIQNLAEIGSSGYLQTATKSFGSPVQPDLSNLGYTLNGQSVTVDVIGSPGTASEETVSQSLDGASTYALSWSDSHTDFQIKVELSTTDATTSPTVSSVTLQS